MNASSISGLARSFGLSRSTLLYYDRVGVLKPSGRTAPGYRYYSKKDRRRLAQICHLRQAGLTLKEIMRVLASGGRPGCKLLNRRLRETTAQIVDLKNQQRLLAGMLMKMSAPTETKSIDKAFWVEMLQAAGMSEGGMRRWHVEFERRAPELHDEFLLSLGLPPMEVERIRAWSREASA